MNNFRKAAMGALLAVATVTSVAPSAAQSGQIVISRVYYADASLSGSPVGFLRGNCNENGPTYRFVGTQTPYFEEGIAGQCIDGEFYPI